MDDKEVLGKGSATRDDILYAVQFLDNGGTLENFSHRHKKLRTAVKNEAKRRLMVDIRYGMNDSRKFKTLIYKKLHKNPSHKLEPTDLYRALSKLSYTTLENLKINHLQPSK